MRINLDNIYSLLDSIMSEYGWTLEYTLNLPHTIIVKLSNAIVSRKKEELKLKAKINAVAVSAGFSGKMELIDKLFNSDEEDTEVNTAQFKAETKALWQKFGKDPEEFERKWAAGEQIVM